VRLRPSSTERRADVQLSAAGGVEIGAELVDHDRLDAANGREFAGLVFGADQTAFD
jgi:hypothetical protein